MPDLDEDASATLMHAVRDLAPAGYLFSGVDAGRVLITLTLLRNLAGFGDQQSCAGALPVILDRQWTGPHARDRAVAGQGRHHKPIGQGDRAKLEGLEEFGRRAHSFVSEKIAGERQMVSLITAAMPRAIRDTHSSPARCRPCGRRPGTACAR